MFDLKQRLFALLLLVGLGSPLLRAMDVQVHPALPNALKKVPKKENEKQSLLLEVGVVASIGAVLLNVGKRLKRSWNETVV